ncbi:hypothetical protein SAMN05216520_103134 [Kandleria vitulina]|jgi:D-alanyl-lipoteichoic acid acyltransferase DltB (MBOAT superfamily)|uniref:hypothetical protein n=1 Tax=Kandleria vitulina TaxID=1630 RepID=UPI00048C5C43|nr:hypothetical protein [Kandleria vitulina]MEE0988388.1 hypothetical protein [Kandleria vitulina]SDL30027.1 hypothetical protein SAMN05216520_103134 [Kandleria vitulina]
MDYTGVALLIGLFVLNACSLYFITQSNLMISGGMNIAAMLATVVLAYHFEQMNNIAIVIIACFVVVLCVVGLKLYLKHKNKNKE